MILLSCCVHDLYPLLIIQSEPLHFDSKSIRALWIVPLKLSDAALLRLYYCVTAIASLQIKRLVFGPNLQKHILQSIPCLHTACPCTFSMWITRFKSSNVQQKQRHLLAPAQRRRSQGRDKADKTLSYWKTFNRLSIMLRTQQGENVF